MGPEIFQGVLEVFIFVLGACLGSFFNVVIYRLPAGKSIVHPGSKCPECATPIAFYDNIPLVSYLLLRGRCRICHTRISFRYPLVEALTGTMGLALFARYGLHFQFCIEFFFVSVLILISFIDLDTYTIPDVLSIPGVAAGFMLSFFSMRLTWLDSLLGIAVGGGLLYLVAYLYMRIRHQDGLGGGDIKLLGMIGAFVGVSGVVFTVLLASLVGSLTGLALMARSRKGLSTMLPFGPFLAFGAVCYLFWGNAFFLWYLSRFAES